MNSTCELVRAAPGVTVAARTARIEIHDARGMLLTGLIDLQRGVGRFEGAVEHQSFPEVPSDLGEALSKDLGDAGSAIAALIGQFGEVINSVRGVGARFGYVLDGGRLFQHAGDRWLPGDPGPTGFGGPQPWQNDPLWVLDLLPSAIDARELEGPTDIGGERCRGFAVEADVIAAAEATARPMRLPSATIAQLRAFPAEVWLDGDGRVRRMRCGEQPYVPELGRWSVDLFDFGVDEPIELPDQWPPAASA